MAARITADDFASKVLESDKLVVVDFYSDSCVACKRLAPVLGDAEDEFEDQISVYKVNTNFDGDLAVQYDVTANPTLLLVKAGEVIDRKVGVVKPDELKSWISENL